MLVGGKLVTVSAGSAIARSARSIIAEAGDAVSKRPDNCAAALGGMNSAFEYPLVKATRVPFRPLHR